MAQMVDHFSGTTGDPNARVMPDPDLVRDRDTLPRLWAADVTAEPVLCRCHRPALRAAKAALNAARTDYDPAAAEIRGMGVRCRGRRRGPRRVVAAGQGPRVHRRRWLRAYPAIAADLDQGDRPTGSIVLRKRDREHEPRSCETSR